MNENGRDLAGRFPKTHADMGAAASMVALLFFAGQPKSLAAEGLTYAAREASATDLEKFKGGGPGP